MHTQIVSHEMEKAKRPTTDVSKCLFHKNFYFPDLVYSVCVSVNKFECFNSQRGHLQGKDEDKSKVFL